ncbi:hypothetical protein ACU8KH_01215 [Lachancea thermotolerans]
MPRFIPSMGRQELVGLVFPNNSYFYCWSRNGALVRFYYFTLRCHNLKQASSDYVLGDP